MGLDAARMEKELLPNDFNEKMLPMMSNPFSRGMMQCCLGESF